MPVSIPLGGPLVAATFEARPNRFVVHARLDNGSHAVAHLPDPGRLRELLLPGRRLWLRPADDPARKTRWSAVLVETPDGRARVCLDTTAPNRLVAGALRRRALPELAGWRLARAEHTVGRSRFDFLLEPAAGRSGPDLLLEVKSVTMVEGHRALFPDAVTARGTRHLRELIAEARAGRHRAAVLFVVQRPDAESVSPAGHIDPEFAQAAGEARSAGVRLLARRCRVEPDRVELGAVLPYEPG